MKKFKILAIGMIALSLFSCTSSNDIIDSNSISNIENDLPSTKVMLQTRSDLMTLAGSNEPSVTEDKITDNKAYFFVRIDNRIPGCKNYQSNFYFPQNTDGGSIFEEGNSGKINLDYEHWIKNDTTTTHKMYVFDTTGEEVAKTLSSQPSLEDLIKTHKSNNALPDLNSDTLKVMWYISKYQSNSKPNDYTWHVDGIVTGELTKDVTEAIPSIKDEESVNVGKLDGYVEVDIHQQEHKDWQEIKTSIHLRDIVDEVKVTIPIEHKYVCDKDDFRLRYYKYITEKSELTSESIIQIKVEYNDSNITITVKSDPAHVQYLMDVYGDGLTIEVHNYLKDITNTDVWDKLKDSNFTTYKLTNKKGQITSAFDKDLRKELK